MTRSPWDHEVSAIQMYAINCCQERGVQPYEYTMFNGASCELWRMEALRLLRLRDDIRALRETNLL